MMKSIIHRFVNLYPVWIILSSILGFVHPPLFSWFIGNLMLYALALVMLGMGLTLNINDFKEILRLPKAVLLVACLQYSVMPLCAWVIGRALNFPSELAVGLIIVGSCPGGTASNVIVFLARGHLALSIVMTTVSTVLAVMATPLLCEALAGAYVPVDTLGLFLTTIKVVLVPVGLGVFLNYKFPKPTEKIADFGPLISVWAIVFIAGSIVAQSAGTITDNFFILFLGVSLLHGIGFLSGYLITRLLGFQERVARTSSVEVGMQNGGLAAVLARQNFPLLPLAAVPAVFCSVIQTLVGGLLAAYWRKQSEKPQVHNQ